MRTDRKDDALRRMAAVGGMALALLMVGFVVTNFMESRDVIRVIRSGFTLTWVVMAVFFVTRR